MTGKPDPEFAVGDEVVCVGDDIDGSWEGAEATVKRVEWNEGGIFAGPRWVYSVAWDDDPDRDEEELDDSDNFSFEHAS